MRKIILSLICLCCFTLAYSQHIHYQKSLNAALTQAAKSKKLVFLTISGPVIPSHPTLKLEQTTTETKKSYNQNFINYTINYTDAAAAPLIKKYKTIFYPSYLFIDTLGNLVYKETPGSASMYKYVNMSAKALTAQATGRTLTNYIARYNMNRNDPVFLKDYITLREELGYDDNADLADQYADLLAAKDFQNYQTVLFIMKAGPYAYGKAYGLCYLNKAITDSLYKNEAPALRSLINGRIINNTMNNAIANKDMAMAQQAVRFTTAIGHANQQKAAVSSASKMLDYYRGINDTAAYFKGASVFYDNYYMNISADSAAKVDQDYFKTINTALIYATNTGNQFADTSAQANAVPLHRVANILNSGAYTFYTLGTHNQTYLTSALLWSKRAIELYPAYHSYDTLAHLLYRLGFFEEAQFTQNKAVKLAVKDKAPTIEIKHLKTELHKIKDKRL